MQLNIRKSQPVTIQTNIEINKMKNYRAKMENNHNYEEQKDI